MQLLSGQNLIGQGIQFLQTAGIGTDLSFSLNMVLNSMFVIGTFFSWILLTYFGRRTIYMFGMGVMSLVLWVIGGLGFIKDGDSRFVTVTYTIGSLLIVRVLRTLGFLKRPWERQKADRTGTELRIQLLARTRLLHSYR